MQICGRVAGASHYAGQRRAVIRVSFQATAGGQGDSRWRGRVSARVRASTPWLVGAYVSMAPARSGHASINASSTPQATQSTRKVPIHSHSTRRVKSPCAVGKNSGYNSTSYSAILLIAMARSAKLNAVLSLPLKISSAGISFEVRGAPNGSTFHPRIIDQTSRLLASLTLCQLFDAVTKQLRLLVPTFLAAVIAKTREGRPRSRKLLTHVTEQNW